MTLEEMIALFSTDGLQKKAAVFDTKKLEWMNGQHLSLTPSAELEPRITPDLIAAGLASSDDLSAKHVWYLSLIDLLKVRARTVHDIVRQAAPYFPGTLAYDEDAVSKLWKDRASASEVLTAVRKCLSELSDWQPAPMEEALRKLAETRGVAAGKIFQPLRLALTGLTVSPGIFDVLFTMGRELSLHRIDDAIRYLEVDQHLLT